MIVCLPHSFPGLILKTSSRLCISLVVRKLLLSPSPRSSQMDTIFSKSASFRSLTGDGRPYSYWDTTLSKYVCMYLLEIIQWWCCIILRTSLLWKMVEVKFNNFKFAGQWCSQLWRGTIVLICITIFPHFITQQYNTVFTVIFMFRIYIITSMYVTVSIIQYAPFLNSYIINHSSCFDWYTQCNN